MKENVYIMLNDVNSETEEFQHGEWSKADEKKLKRKVLSRIHQRKKKKIVMAGTCVAASLALLIVLPFRGEAADAVEQLSYRIGSYLGIDRDLDPYEQVVNQSISQDGIAVTLNSVILDENEMVVSTTETYDEPLTDEMSGLSGDIYVNGTHAFTGASGSSMPLDDHTIESVISYDLNNIDVNETLNITLRFQEYETGKSGWKFEFKATGAQLMADTQTIDLAYQWQLPDGSTISLTRYTSNAMGQNIYYKAKGSENDYDMMLKGTDDLGNPVSFYVTRSDREGGKFVIENYNGNLSSEASALTLVPYAVKMPESSGQMSNDYKQTGEEFTITLK